MQDITPLGDLVLKAVINNKSLEEINNLIDYIDEIKRRKQEEYKRKRNIKIRKLFPALEKVKVGSIIEYSENETKVTHLKCMLYIKPLHQIDDTSVTFQYLIGTRKDTEKCYILSPWSTRTIWGWIEKENTGKYTCKIPCYLLFLLKDVVYMLNVLLQGKKIIVKEETKTLVECIHGNVFLFDCEVAKD